MEILIPDPHKKLDCDNFIYVSICLIIVVVDKANQECHCCSKEVFSVWLPNIVFLVIHCKVKTCVMYILYTYMYSFVYALNYTAGAKNT